MDALSRALRWEPDAIDHLCKLRDTTAASRRTKANGTAPIVERVEALVEAVSPDPAHVLDRLSNIVAANTEGLALVPELLVSNHDRSIGL